MSPGEAPGGGDGPAPPLSAAFISPGWPPGAYANGIIPYIANVAQKMRDDGHTVTVVAMYAKGGVDGRDVREASPFRRAPSLAARAADAIAFRASPEVAARRVVTRSLISECRKLIRERGLQVVEIEESHGWSRWLQRALPIPVVARIHGPWFINGPLRGAPEDARFRRQVRQEGRALAESRAITSPSLDILERTRKHYGLPLGRAEVIPNPTAMVPADRRWRPEEAEPETIAFVGRFDRHKGGDLVIDAFAELARRRPGARLLFAGPDGDDFLDDDGRPRSIHQHVALRFPGDSGGSRVEYLGLVAGDAIPAVRRRAAVVVIGSRYDNFPTTALEAMAMGCPLVAPRIGGIPEIVDDGVSGLLFEPGDAADMAEKVGRILGDPALAARLGRRAGLDCERRFDPATLARRTADHFRRVIGAGGPEGRGGPAR